MFYLILCSCLTLMTSEMESDELFGNAILWEFDILSSATTQAIPPCDPDTDDELDNVRSPVDLHQATDCNCFNLPTNPPCLVDIHTHRMLEDEEVELVDISAVNGEN